MTSGPEQEDKAITETVAHLAPQPEVVTGRRRILGAVIVFVAALAVRVLFISAEMRHHGLWVWPGQYPFSSSDEMSGIATNLAQGRGFSSPYSPGTTPTAWLCPLVPLLSALVIRCLGSAVKYFPTVMGYIDTIPSACCVVVYWLIARHAARNSSAHRTALLTAVLFCIWPASLYSIRYLWYFPWQELATSLVVLFGMRWIDRPNLKTAAALGMMGGILALINVTPLPIFAVALLLPVLQNRQGRRRISGCAASGAALALLIVLPWLVRNAVVLHTLTLRSGWGIALQEGNSPNGCVSENAACINPGIEESELERYQRLGEVKYSRQASRNAFAYMRSHPRETLTRIGQRVYKTWLTDAMDQFPAWGEPPHWVNGRPAILPLCSSLGAWVTVTLLLWAAMAGRFRGLPYKWLFVSILFFLPLPYYFTIAGNNYSQILWSWLLLLAILVLSARFRRNSGLPLRSGRL